MSVNLDVQRKRRVDVDVARVDGEVLHLVVVSMCLLSSVRRGGAVRPTLSSRGRDTVGTGPWDVVRVAQAIKR